MARYALVLQTCPYDIRLAAGLASLIADIQPEFSRDADFIISYRKDVFSSGAIERVLGAKFNVRTFRTVARADGWPHGPNNQWRETLLWITKERRVGRAPYEALFMFEPDCVPLHRDWVRLLFDEWHRLGRPAFMGSMSYFDGKHLHLNGNMVLVADAMERFPSLKRPLLITGGWDAYHSGIIVPNSKQTELLHNEYRRNKYPKVNVTDADWDQYDCDELFGPKWGHLGSDYEGKQIQPIFMHGTKHTSAQACVRKRLLGS